MCSSLVWLMKLFIVSQWICRFNLLWTTSRMNQDLRLHWHDLDEVFFFPSFFPLNQLNRWPLRRLQDYTKHKIFYTVDFEGTFLNHDTIYSFGSVCLYFVHTCFSKSLHLVLIGWSNNICSQNAFFYFIFS